MNIVIRTDSSVSIGSGHVMRCLTLADSLHEMGGKIGFICRELPGSLCGFIENKGYEVYRLQEPGQFSSQFKKKQSVENKNGFNWKMDMRETGSILLQTGKVIDWLIVDHYGLDWRWQSSMRSYAKHIMVIDDLANRRHDCDILLDQNFHKKFKTRYDTLVPPHCTKFLGPQYTLLRAEFMAAREKKRDFDGVIRRIIIFFGGGDPTNQTEKALRAVRLIKHSEISIDVVIGELCPHKERIKRICASIPNSTYYCQTDNMAELLLKADLAIGSAGTSSWERCYLGIPTIVIVIADNQTEIAAALEDAGAIWNLGWYEKVTDEYLAEAIQKALMFPERVRQTRQEAQKIMGKFNAGEGVADLIGRMIGVSDAHS